MGDTDPRAQGREAIRQAAVAHDLPTDLIILSERWNTVVQLGDSGVVAKAASIGHLARRDSSRWYQQELDACGQLVANGAPVQTPYADSVFVHEDSDIPVSLWRVIPGEMGEANELQLVDSLAEIHRAGAQITLDQPWFATITCHFPDVFAAFRERQLLQSHTIGRMDGQYQRLMEELRTFDFREGFIHGDAQRKNAILNGNRVTWIDFEECSIGPFAWDLACLAKHAGFETKRILDRYAELTGQNRVPDEAIAVLQDLRDLEALTWMIAVQEERELAFQQATADWLQRWLLTAG